MPSDGKHLLNYGFRANPQNINRRGRPRKFTTALREIGYSKSEINDTIQTMLAMNYEELRAVFEQKNATILEKTIAAAMKKSLEKGTLYAIETLLSRAFGLPKQDIETTLIAEQPLFSENENDK